MKTFTHRIFCLILALLIFASAASCSDNSSESEPESEISSASVSESESETETESESETESEAETDVPTLPDEDELITDPTTDIDETAAESEEETDAETASDTESAETPEEDEGRIFSYLNGRTVTKEERDRRPVAIMINNIKNSLPQSGISQGDIYYECAAEGGITRIMMLVEDYENLGTVGSIRSSRDYFVDFLANHDALYVHAGGSPLAYAKISYRGINNIDGVNGYTSTVFWRDNDRRVNMGYEHSLMTSGEGIMNGIEFYGYRTELDENQVPMFNFYDEETDNHIIGSPASHIRMQSTSIQTVDFVYNEETGEYLRYQYNGIPHVDAENDEQISVKNVLILFTDISLVPGDEAGRLEVGTVGSGQGYYITNGKRKVVNWSRETKTSTIHIEYRNGDELILNSGKTFICVVDDSVAAKINFEYEW